MNSSALIALWVSLLSGACMLCMAAGHDPKAAAFFGLFTTGGAIIFKKETLK